MHNISVSELTPVLSFKNINILEWQTSSHVREDPKISVSMQFVSSRDNEYLDISLVQTINDPNLLRCDKYSEECPCPYLSISWLFNTKINIHTCFIVYIYKTLTVSDTSFTTHSYLDCP